MKPTAPWYTKYRYRLFWEGGLWRCHYIQPGKGNAEIWACPTDGTKGPTVPPAWGNGFVNTAAEPLAVAILKTLGVKEERINRHRRCFAWTLLERMTGQRVEFTRHLARSVWCDVVEEDRTEEGAAFAALVDEDNGKGESK